MPEIFLTAQRRYLRNDLIHHEIVVSDAKNNNAD